jgi:hypothetical protein
MKKIVLIMQILAFAAYGSSASASGGHGRGHGKHHRYYSHEYYPEGRYYGPPPPPVYQDRRTHQGLAGGVVGSVLGYELGNGHPLATGVGAAAGSFLGNELSGRR